MFDRSKVVMVQQRFTLLQNNIIPRIAGRKMLRISQNSVDERLIPYTFVPAPKLHTGTV